jgi:hypothetical protein
MRICETIILPMALYGREILSLTLREEYTLRVLEYSVLWRMQIFGPKRVDVAGWWGKLHDEEFHTILLAKYN